MCTCDRCSVIGVPEAGFREHPVQTSNSHQLLLAVPLRNAPGVHVLTTLVCSDLIVSVTYAEQGLCGAGVQGFGQSDSNACLYVGSDGERGVLAQKSIQKGAIIVQVCFCVSECHITSHMYESNSDSLAILIPSRHNQLATRYRYDIFSQYRVLAVRKSPCSLSLCPGVPASWGQSQMHLL